MQFCAPGAKLQCPMRQSSFVLQQPLVGEQYLPLTQSFAVLEQAIRHLPPGRTEHVSAAEGPEGVAV